jgi:hypothetical protein
MIPGRGAGGRQPSGILVCEMSMDGWRVGMGARGWGWHDGGTVT